MRLSSFLHDSIILILGGVTNYETYYAILKAFCTSCLLCHPSVLKCPRSVLGNLVIMTPTLKHITNCINFMECVETETRLIN
jgi:hypothetical protein